MQNKTNDNANLPDRQFDAICKQIIEVLEGIGHFQRRFFPPEFPTLRDDLRYLRMALKKTVDEFEQIPVPSESDQPLEEAIRAAIDRKPKGHDFDYSRQKADGQVSRHMSHTGG